jgi:hypothetical protein
MCCRRGAATGRGRQRHRRPHGCGSVDVPVPGAAPVDNMIGQEEPATGVAAAAPERGDPSYAPQP